MRVAAFVRVQDDVPRRVFVTEHAVERYTERVRDLPAEAALRECVRLLELGEVVRGAPAWLGRDDPVGLYVVVMGGEYVIPVQVDERDGSLLAATVIARCSLDEGEREDRTRGKRRRRQDRRTRQKGRDGGGPPRNRVRGVLDGWV